VTSFPGNRVVEEQEKRSNENIKIKSVGKKNLGR
jgi:hypothetical protein